MHRHRIFAGEWDSRAILLSRGLSADADEQSKELHRANTELIRQSLIEEFGSDRYEEKEANFVELGPRTWSVIAYHNEFAIQSRTAFVMGAYYPALAGACALGERILNHLIIGLRDEFDGTPEHGRVSRGKSLKQWGTIINVLKSWGVFSDEVAQDFDRLANKRNAALHFHPDTDVHVRRQALNALRLLDDIIKRQFGAFNPKPWLIPGTLGASFVRKVSEDDPFVKLIYLPNSAKVGPCHTISHDRSGNWFLHDDYDYSEREITDEDFRELFNAGHKDGFCNSIARSG